MHNRSQVLTSGYSRAQESSISKQLCENYIYWANYSDQFFLYLVQGQQQEASCNS